MNELSTVLDTEISVNTRPYSQNELNFMKTRAFNNLRLGKVLAEHDSCGHSYLVKNNGRKEKEIKENGNSGNCSICWSLSKTPDRYQERAYDLMNSYYEMKHDDYLNYGNVTMEILFYKWLYIG